MPHLMIYVQCQHSVPVQGAVCPAWSKAESKNVEGSMFDLQETDLLFLFAFLLTGTTFFL